MSDFFSNLPLSNRARHDESHVTSDRRAALADTIDHAAMLLAEAPFDERVRNALADAFLEDARVSSDGSAASGLGSVSKLTEAAQQIRAGRRRNVRALSHAVRALLRLGVAVDRSPTIPPLTSGSVALYAVTAAPLERRAVVGGHTIRATDADWAFGHGPVLEGAALDIVAFLLGVSDHPPQPPVPRPAGR